MNQINQRQNLPKSIKLLAAQRQTYSNAKSLLGIYALLAIPLMLLVNLVLKPFILNHYEFDLTNLIAILALLLTLLDVLWLKDYVRTLQEKAATIQEEFDRYVYNLKWDPILLGEKVSDVCVEKMYSKYAESHELSKLHDWYTPTVSQHSELKGILLCQNENVGWDIELRNSYIAYVLVFIIIFVLSLIYLGVSNKATLESFIMSYFIPSMPILIYFRNAYSDHRKAVKDKTKLRDSLKNALDSQNIKIKTVESIQFQILNNRKTNPLIFDFFNYIKSERLQRLITSATKSL
ncbi:S-4TM family putative pore-forming effector [Aeromonas sanarellii]|uniref:S-4TM family putative pore-forming effector n=1 Tax=Aeromonas TaxID=642 RepID=UPI002B496C9D|nr:S-4TM family putative pore-forming effector [Aeromonas caviae]